jgi:hypothetical protein
METCWASQSLGSYAKGESGGTLFLENAHAINEKL